METEQWLIANWKMNLNVAQSQQLASDLIAPYGMLLNELRRFSRTEKKFHLVVCPSFVALPVVSERVRDSEMSLGAQNMFWESRGSFTGEVSPVMLKELGCQYVILGHSERREYCGETNQMIHKKVQAAIREQLMPIVCIGETLQERESHATVAALETQLNEILTGVEFLPQGQLMIAYEPVWAIGTGVVITKDDLQDVISLIYQVVHQHFGESWTQLNLKILYGGSISEMNIGDITSCQHLNGVLVSSAATDTKSLLAMAKTMLLAQKTTNE